MMRWMSLLAVACLVLQITGCARSSDGNNAPTKKPNAERGGPPNAKPTDNDAPENKQRKRDAKEKLLLLEKEQTQKQIDNLNDSITFNVDSIAKNERAIAKADADLKAERISTYDSLMLQGRLKDENKLAEERRDRFLRLSAELREKIKGIDAQLKQLYEEALKE